MKIKPKMKKIIVYSDSKISNKKIKVGFLKGRRINTRKNFKDTDDTLYYIRKKGRYKIIE